MAMNETLVIGFVSPHLSLNKMNNQVKLSTAK